MNKHLLRPLIIVLIITISPGCLVLIYSGTFIQSGIGAVSFSWERWGGGEVSLNVNASYQQANITISAEGLRINSFNTSGAIVSILVVSERNGTLLNKSMVSGVVSGFTFPNIPATGWVASQDFDVIANWEGTNTTVRFYYETMFVMHADGSVFFTMPGFHEAQSLGYLLLGGGLVVFMVCAAVIRSRNRQ